MSEPRFDIIFRGECLNNFPMEQVKQQFATLFKASPEKIEQLFSGNPVTLKKELDRESTLKFKQHFEKIGAKIHIKPSGVALAPAAQAVTTTAPPTPQQAAPSAVQNQPSLALAAATLDILPVGSDILTAAERSKTDAVAPDTSHLSTAAVGSDLLEGFADTQPTAIAPDISHLSMAEVGSDINPHAKAEIDIQVPDISFIDLAELGADIDPSEKTAPPPAPNVEHIKLS